MGADDDALSLVLDREAARGGISSLAEREKRVLYLRFFAGMTQSAIAAELGISPIHVSRLIGESCRRIREGAESADYRGTHPHSDKAMQAHTSTAEGTLTAGAARCPRGQRFRWVSTRLIRTPVGRG
ncbi:sigma factor-like helix-turn-helix DNA-binding protein [Streptomyces globisporus]|uniref:sigma factor-like helix-turn-helix DNA-binding protein n=1 Tax=Streptomyces globisporus TaxID=1908 RepID=UPI0037951CFF